MKQLALSLFAIGCLGIFGNGATAALVAQEDFESYAPAALDTANGGTGWLGAWTANSNMSIVPANLSFQSGTIKVDGGSRAAQHLAPDGGIQVVASREFPNQTSSPLYLSFLYQETVNTGDSDFFQVGLLNAANNPDASIIDQSNVWTVRRGSSTNTTSAIPTVTGQTYFLVLKLEDVVGDSDYDQLTMFVDPMTPNEGANASTVTGTTNGLLDLSANAFLNIRRAFQENGDTVLVDEFRVGTTFASVISIIPEPSTGLLLTGLALLVAGRRRRQS